MQVLQVRSSDGLFLKVDYPRHRLDVCRRGEYLIERGARVAVIALVRSGSGDCHKRCLWWNLHRRMSEVVTCSHPVTFLGRTLNTKELCVQSRPPFVRPVVDFCNVRVVLHTFGSTGITLGVHVLDEPHDTGVSGAWTRPLLSCLCRLGSSAWWV